MKEMKYYLSKLIKRHTIPLLLLTVLMVLFFVNFFNRPNVYASELIAKVDCEINVINGDNVETVSKDHKLISSVDEANINFSDIKTELTSRSKIEVNYNVENISTGDCVFSLNLNKLEMENFDVEYSINDGEFVDLDSVINKINAAEIANIKVVISIDDLSKNAVLNGSLNLTFNM